MSYEDEERAVAKRDEGGGFLEVAQSRAVAEAQAAMTVAKRFPRDTVGAFHRIKEACKRHDLAKQAMYAYPRGGQTVTGPSIRLAEAMAQNWGNLDFGTVEVEQRKGESTMLAYCIDLETNVRQTKCFVVKHERKAHGKIVKLDDPRDIYELTANNAARRLRACILGVIPGDIVEAAVEQCEKTLKNGNGKPLIDRIRQMVSAFAELSVTQEMIEKRLNHKIEVTSEVEMINLQKIFQSLRDGMSKREDWFELPKASAAQDLNKADLSPKAAPEISDAAEPPLKPGDFGYGEQAELPKKKK